MTGTSSYPETAELLRELRYHERNFQSLIHGPLCGQAADEIERLRGVAQSAWHPMETAPKDGTRIILSWGGKSVSGSYLDNSKAAHMPWQGWRVPSMEIRPHGQPDAWQPFPAPTSLVPSTDRACTCDPSERPDPCQKKYAYSECMAAAGLSKCDCGFSAEACATNACMRKKLATSGLSDAKYPNTGTSSHPSTHGNTP